MSTTVLFRATLLVLLVVAWIVVLGCWSPR